jgi:hypothetical protein
VVQQLHVKEVERPSLALKVHNPQAFRCRTTSSPPPGLELDGLQAREPRLAQAQLKAPEDSSCAA